jgi:hypothetical protein
MTDFSPSQLNHMDTRRLAAYRFNLDFYRGNHWPTQSRHRQLVFNYAKVAIDKATSFLMPGLNFACYPVADTTGDNEAIKVKVRRAEQLLRQVYEENNLQQLDYETEIDAAVLGDGCYKVIWDTERKRIRITAPDVSGIYAWWLGDDTSRVWIVASRYTLTQDEVLFLYGRAIERKQSIITEVWTAGTFELFVDSDLMESKPNPYGFIPFIIYPNLREPKKFWGTSDIPALIQPQRELNRALSQLSRILELSGNPIAVLENISSAEDIKVQPGALWTIPEDARAYLLDLLQGGGVRLHVDYIDLLYRALHDISETPRAAWGGVEKELSGTALQIELGSLTQKVNRKRTIRTSAYHRRNAMILKLAEMFLSEDFEGVSHRVVWGRVLPEDAGRQVQNEQLLVQAGVHSRRTAMDRARILKMNREFRAPSTRGGARAREVAADTEMPKQ